MTVYSTHHLSTFCTVVNVAGQTGGLLNKLSPNLHYHAVSVLENGQYLVFHSILWVISLMKQQM
jgi:hypothetical protein